MTLAFPVGDDSVLIDEADLPLVQRYSWRIKFSKDGGRKYAQGPSGYFMHRMILNAPRGAQVDHINGNSLDNRRANLRLCTAQQNQANTGPRTGRFKGVSQTKHGTFRAVIHFHRKQISLGSFANEVDAARAYDSAAEELFGGYARLNNPAAAQ